MVGFLVAASTEITFGEALGNMIVGILIVFLALLFLCGVISLFKFIGSSQKKPAEVKKPEAPAVKQAAPEPVDDGLVGGEKGEVVAAILAAVAQKAGPNAVVTSITRVE